MRIVLDNTILVRANEHSQGLARELLLNITAGEHQLVLSNEMLHELARVLRYPRMQRFFNLSEDRVFEYINYLRERSELVTLDPLIKAPIRDVNDIIVMQTAIVGEADVICTTDDDFFERSASGYIEELGIAVLTDVALMRRLRS